MNNLIGKAIGKKQIWTKKSYILFRSIMMRPKIKKSIYLGLVNSELDNKDKDKAS